MPTEIIFPQNQATAASFHILSNSLFITTIRTDITESAIEYTFNSSTPYTCRPVDMFALSDICHVQTVLTPFMMAKYYHPAYFGNCPFQFSCWAKRAKQTGLSETVQTYV